MANDSIEKKFSRFPPSMWGMAFFRILTNRVLAVKIRNMQEEKCTERFKGDVDWPNATAAEYATKCPMNNCRKVTGRPVAECPRWKDCEIALILRKVSGDCKQIDVSIEVHTEVNSEMDSLVPEKKMLDYAREVWKAVESSDKPLDWLIHQYETALARHKSA